MVRVQDIAALALVLLTGVSLAAPGRRLEVQSIEIAARGDGTRVNLRLSRTGDFDLFTLSGPDRVVLDIRSAALGPTALPIPAPAGLVRRIRVAHRPGGDLRMVFDVAEPISPRGVFASDGAQPHLSITLRPTTLLLPGARAREPASAAVATPRPADPAPASVTVPSDVGYPAPAGAESPASGPSQPRRNLRELVIAVDAGHGGHDPGARGPHGVWEKDVTLAIGQRLAALIDREPGMRGVLTRKSDQFVVLRQRMERARAANADLFVSIHADAAHDREARGSTVYVLSEKGATDEAARRLAARENAADLIGGVELGNKDPVLASVLMDLSQNASISSSITVGDSILEEMARLGRLHRNNVQQAPFMVLKSPDVPSVLIETAFISNPADERSLDSGEYQDHLAQAILAGIRKYFRANPPQGTLMASLARREAPDAVQHLIRRGDTLSTIASRYNVSVQRIRSENGIRGDAVRIGQRLRIPAEET